MFICKSLRVPLPSVRKHGHLSRLSCLSSVRFSDHRGTPPGAAGPGCPGERSNCRDRKFCPRELTDTTGIRTADPSFYCNRRFSISGIVPFSRPFAFLFFFSFSFYYNCDIKRGPDPTIPGDSPRFTMWSVVFIIYHYLNSQNEYRIDI